MNILSVYTIQYIMYIYICATVLSLNLAWAPFSQRARITPRPRRVSFRLCNVRIVRPSLVNQTPIPQRWVYFITSTRKEGLGILGTNPWHSGIFTSRKRNAIFYRKTFCCTSFEFYALFMILNYSFGLYWLKAINKVPKCSKILNT